MAFTSPVYIIFFALAVPLILLAPARVRLLVIVAAGAIFYGYAGLGALSLLALTTLADYVIARALAPAEGRRRRALLFASLAHNLGLLALFKYLNIFADLGLLVPLGISFYTFTRIAYMLDVYRRRIEPERDLLAFAAFVGFFPNLISGPIERAAHLIPQLRAAPPFDPARTVDGLRLILWGAFKKAVIADRLAIYVNTVYDSPANHGGLTVIIATVFLAFQIYCDFSGYTDIARGTALILGVDLFENFRQPYLARSVLDFWRRWHMSLTNLIREFLFLPLSRWGLTRTGRRWPRLVEVVVYLVVMALVGLWHGASPTFVVWGLLHGVYMGIETLWNAVRGRRTSDTPVSAVARTLWTFALVSLAWVFFRAVSLDHAFVILGRMTVFDGADLSAPFAGAVLSPGIEFGLSLALIAGLMLIEWADSRERFAERFSRAPGVVRWATYYLMSGAVLFSGLYGVAANEFIYFQF